MPSIDLLTFLKNLADTFPPLFVFILVAAGAYGAWMALQGIWDAYQVAIGEAMWANRPPTLGGALSKFIIGVGMTTLPILMSYAAVVVTDKPTETASSVFDYTSGSVATKPYCEAITTTVSLYALVIGGLAWFYAGHIWYQRSNGQVTRSGSPVVYIIAGTCCIFLNDVLRVIANTTSIDFTLSNFCATLG